jgi:hypothetical protein
MARSSSVENDYQLHQPSIAWFLPMALIAKNHHRQAWPMFQRGKHWVKRQPYWHLAHSLQWLSATMASSAPILDTPCTVCL